MSGRWMRVELGYAAFGVHLDSSDHVDATAPIGSWMRGKHWPVVERWVEKKGGSVMEMKL